MCGRYASSRSREELVVEFDITEDGPADPADEPAGRPRYNIAPTDRAAVVLERVGPRTAASASSPPAAENSTLDATDALVTAALGAAVGSSSAGPDPGRSGAVSAQAAGDAVRQLRALRWGLVPSWSKTASGGARMINARLETLLSKGAFRSAALRRRCLVPADGWYEWQPSPTVRTTRGKPRKQPFFIGPTTGRGLAFGGVYEFWRDPALDPEDPQAWLVSFAVITTAAEPGLDAIHDRMPLVLPPERWDDWLDPGQTHPDAVRELSSDLPVGRFAATAVGLQVNSVRNDGPHLLDPAPADSLEGVVDPATGELLGSGPGELF